MTGLGYQDGVPMVSALMCMPTHWTGPMVSRDIRLSSSHDFTKLLQCIVSQPWENLKLVPKLIVDLTNEWNPKVIIYSL